MTQIRSEGPDHGRWNHQAFYSILLNGERKGGNFSEKVTGWVASNTMIQQMMTKIGLECGRWHSTPQQVHQVNQTNRHDHKSCSLGY